MFRLIPGSVSKSAVAALEKRGAVAFFFYRVFADRESKGGQFPHGVYWKQGPSGQSGMSWSGASETTTLHGPAPEE